MSLRSYFLDWAGPHPAGHPVHTKLRALQPGQRVRLSPEGSACWVVDEAGSRLALSFTFVLGAAMTESVAAVTCVLRRLEARPTLLDGGMPSERELRALRRQHWAGGLTRTHEPAQLPTPEERLASMWQLALDAWSLRGEPLPSYERAEIPGRVIRPR